jgi:hypothetical protein
MGEHLPRRRFLTSLTAGLLSSGAALRPASGQDLLYVLKPGEIDRLRTDFNLNRERVRLLAILSPT